MRWFTALNIKDTDAYRNVNARLVYLHMLCSMDYNTRAYTIGARSLAAELGLTYKAVRCAIDALLTAGLIGVQPWAQSEAQSGAQQRAQSTTYIIRGLDAVGGAVGGASEGAVGGASEGAVINNNNKNNSLNKNNFSLTRAYEEFLKKELIAYVSEYCKIGPLLATALMKDFMRSMTIKKRDGWSSKEDAWQHLLDWSLKHKNDKAYNKIYQQ